MIVIVFGLPGSGKSYFATRLVKKLKARYVSSDIIRKDFTFKSKYSYSAKWRMYMKMLEEML